MSVGHMGELKVGLDGTINRVQKQISEVSAKMDNNFIKRNSILRSAFVAKVAARLVSLSPITTSLSQLLTTILPQDDRDSLLTSALTSQEQV